MRRRLVLSMILCLAAACGSNDASSKSASAAADTGKTGSATPAPVSAPTLKAGDVAPAFSLQGSDGQFHRLADHAGKEAVVVAWFPKAFTGG